jgi:serine protease Do
MIPGIRRPRVELGLTAVLLSLVAGCASGLWPPTRQDVLQRTLTSAVQVLIEQPDGQRIRSASGVAIGSRPGSKGRYCFVLTSGHTVNGLTEPRQVFAVFGSSRGGAEKVSATVLAARESEGVDLALLGAESDRCTPARSASAPILGEPVWVVGFPFGRPLTLASGVVSQVKSDSAADRDAASRLMVDATVSHGSSGGGVYEARDGGLIGLVEGYNTARVTARGVDPPWYIDVPVPGQTFVAPLADIRQFLKETGYANLMPAETARANPVVERLANGPLTGQR